jgi:hypothetical protein
MMSQGGSAKGLIQAAGHLIVVTSLLGQAAPLPLAAPAMGLVGPHVSATLDGGYGCPNLGCSALFGLSVGYTNRPWHFGGAVASINPDDRDGGWSGGIAVRKLLRFEEGNFSKATPALHAGLSFVSRPGSVDQVDIPIALAISAALPAVAFVAAPWATLRTQVRVSDSPVESSVWRVGGGLSGGVEIYKASGGGALLYWGGRLALDALFIDGPGGDGPFEWSITLSVLRRKF